MRPERMQPVQKEGNDMGKWRIWAAVLAGVLTVAVLLALGPFDVFSHGYYCEPVSFEQIDPEDVTGYIDLGQQAYEGEFIPQQDHFAGIAVYFAGRTQDGSITITILDKKDGSNGRVLDEICTDGSRIGENAWYRAYAGHSLKKGERYGIRISAQGCMEYPKIPLVVSNYRPPEASAGDALLCFAYARPTFGFCEKVLLSMFLFSGLLLAEWALTEGFWKQESRRKLLAQAGGVLFLCTVLSWNFMYNSMDNLNTMFAGFQSDSDALVSEMIAGDQRGAAVSYTGFGLGRIASVGNSFANDGTSWQNGYSCDRAAVLLPSNEYTRLYAVPGNFAVFPKGGRFQITDIADDGAGRTVFLDAQKPLREIKYGSLSDIRFLDKNAVLLPGAVFQAPYRSQYGLQGKIFLRMARFLDEEDCISILELFNCAALSVVCVLLVLLIGKKHDRILAGCFYITFWLSPWVVSFAGSLYWTAFLWFAPMLGGLACSVWIENRWVCRIETAGIGFAVLLKCLCGYEYLSSIMTGAVLFLAVDFAVAVHEKNRKRAALALRVILYAGLAAVAGFVLALSIHAPLKSGGSVWEGIRIIFEQDLLRRTGGADLNSFDAVYWDSFNASAWSVFCRYFHFGTQVLAGIPGNLFPLLCVVPLAVFVYDGMHKKLDIAEAALYAASFFAAVSWFVLAKAHSHIHTHMNYVLWYFGFVQACLYIPLKRVCKRYRFYLHK